ncbi:hypothetical protein NHQ30_011338 [Ciborinia camelliae]|nr:hypothetical protein NHQ30_011338 [Ciborinia camelliae]
MTITSSHEIHLPPDQPPGPPPHYTVGGYRRRMSRHGQGIDDLQLVHEVVPSRSNVDRVAVYERSRHNRLRCPETDHGGLVRPSTQNHELAHDPAGIPAMTQTGSE